VTQYYATPGNPVNDVTITYLDDLYIESGGSGSGNVILNGGFETVENGGLISPQR
jgi:autotransporter passenger strand-loop-strand repeat protein